MASPNDPANRIFINLQSNGFNKYLSKTVPFGSFFSICKSSDAPHSMLQCVQVHSHESGSGRDFLSIFRFKTRWSIHVVGQGVGGGADGGAGTSGVVGGGAAGRDDDGDIAEGAGGGGAVRWWWQCWGWCK
ncbi:hypothetical protein ACOSP7_000561 [Xanthoceras sorbifolium]